MRFILPAVSLLLLTFGIIPATSGQNQLRSAVETPPANKTAVKPGPTSPYLNGLQLIEAGKYAAAAAALRLAVEHDPNDAAAYGKLGVAYVALRQYKDAVVVFKMAIKIKPELVGAEEYYQLSNAYIALEKFPLALAAIEQALKVKRAELASGEDLNTTSPPTMADLHYAIGLIYYNMRRYSVAVIELKQAIALNSKHAPAHFGLAITYLASGDRLSAQKQQSILDSLDPVYAAQLARLLLATKPNEVLGFGSEP